MVPDFHRLTGTKVSIDIYPWGTSSYSSSYDWNAVSRYKVGGRGPKVVYPWGVWQPVRDYTRDGTVLYLNGYYEILGSTPDIWNSPYREIRYGFPGYISDPLVTLQARMPSHSGGLLDYDRYPMLTQNMRNRLITECIVKIGDRKANYGEAIAEGRETLSFIAKTSLRMFRAYKALRRGNLVAFVKALGASKKRLKPGMSAAHAWLEYQYAWMPLLNDIYDSYNVLRDGINRKSLTLAGVRQIESEADYVDVNDYWWDLQGTVKVRHRCKLFFRLTNETADNFYSLGLINPAEVAWAIVPYSFVIDWFLPVGNVLEAYSALQGLTYVDGGITSKADVSGKGPRKLPGYFETDFEWKFEHFAIRREKVYTAIPALYVKSPFSSTHVTSALALLRNLRR